MIGQDAGQAYWRAEKRMNDGKDKLAKVKSEILGVEAEIPSDEAGLKRTGRRSSAQRVKRRRYFRLEAGSEEMTDGENDDNATVSIRQKGIVAALIGGVLTAAMIYGVWLLVHSQ
jgi:hypothetical protein